jgi:hypothetical protein
MKVASLPLLTSVPMPSAVSSLSCRGATCLLTFEKGTAACNRAA